MLTQPLRSLDDLRSLTSKEEEVEPTRIHSEEETMQKEPDEVETNARYMRPVRRTVGDGSTCRTTSANFFWKYCFTLRMAKQKNVVLTAIFRDSLNQCHHPKFLGELHYSVVIINSDDGRGSAGLRESSEATQQRGTANFHLRKCDASYFNRMAAAAAAAALDRRAIVIHTIRRRR